jgi:phage replication initiation protein
MSDRAEHVLSPPSLTGGESFFSEAVGRFEPGAAKVDWMTVTWLPEPDEHVAAQVRDVLRLLLGDVQGREARPGRGYEMAVEFFIRIDETDIHVARADYGGSFHKGRARFDLSGAGCSKVASWDVMQDWISTMFDFKLTRVDLAVDCLQGEYDIDDAASWYGAGDFNAGGRNPRHSTIGDWLSIPSYYGRTLEIGRSENGKMLRCYEKGKQLGDPHSPWVRFEVELRNNDRIIPLETLTKCGSYFAGAYKCLARIMDGAATRIQTQQKEEEITQERLVAYARSAYGTLLNHMGKTQSPKQIIEQIARPGIPKRLERSALGGNTGSLKTTRKKPS